MLSKALKSGACKISNDKLTDPFINLDHVCKSNYTFIDLCTNIQWECTWAQAVVVKYNVQFCIA